MLGHFVVEDKILIVQQPVEIAVRLENAPRDTQDQDEGVSGDAQIPRGGLWLRTKGASRLHQVVFHARKAERGSPEGKQYEPMSFTIGDVPFRVRCNTMSGEDQREEQ